MAGTISQIAHGIGEVPSNVDLHPSVISFLNQLRNAVIRQQGVLTPAGPVKNLRATPVAGGAIIDFTRTDGDNHIIYTSPTPVFSNAFATPIGQGQRWFHDAAKGGVKNFYWVQALKANGAAGQITGPVNATTLALGTDATVPGPPPAKLPPVTYDNTKGVIKD